MWLVKVMIMMMGMVWGAESSRILAFVPMPAKSHQRLIQPLLKELALRGHHVTCVTPLPPDDIPPNYKTVMIPNFMPQMMKLFGSGGPPSRQEYINMRGVLSKFLFVSFKGLGLSFTEWILDLKEVQEIISSNDNYDAIILETTFLQESFIALGHKFNAPVIEFLPAGNLLWSYWLLGNPYDTSYIVDAMLPYGDKMSFTERLTNTALNLVSRLAWYNYYMPKYEAIMNEKLRYDGWESRPPMMDMISNTSLVLVNTHFSINYPYPNSPHFKEVGGLNIEPVKPLPKDLEVFMEEAKDGVIFFTLGSNIEVSHILGDDLIGIFVQVFKELKQRVLWKWETEFPGSLPKNVKISKWFPQQDILAHKNMKLFITHGGLLSTTEAVYRGVPTVGIPVAADQYKNVEHMRRYNYGIPLNLDNITYESLKWSVNEVLSNPMYKENAKKRSNIFTDKPQTALETAVYWTEYVIRHKGAAHLRPAIATMPWYQQAMIDVYSTMAAVILISLYILYKLTRCFFRLICRCGSNKKESSKKKQKTQ